jgi:hypothetical protein
MTTFQESLFETAMELIRIDRRLLEIGSTISLPPDLGEMQEDRIPHDVHAHVSALISTVRCDLLSDAIKTLTLVSEITDADLRAEYRRRWVG